MEFARRTPLHTQGGIALIAVLWVVAIMSLITVGLVQSVRSEIRTVGLDRQRVQAQAVGEAAIALAAQQITQLQDEQPDVGIHQIPITFGAHHVTVTAQPLAGIVSVLSAPNVVLAPILQHAGGLSENEAMALADQIVLWRSSATAVGTMRGMDALEDLLQVPGMHYDLYARVAPFLTASQRRQGLDLHAASPELLVMFGLQPNQLPPARQQQAQPFFRFTAQVDVEHLRFEVRRDMRVNSQPDTLGMYWQILDGQIKVSDSSR